MKKILFLVVVLAYYDFSEAQVLCINCYHQNIPVSTAVTNMVSNGSFEVTTCPPNNVHQFTNCPSAINYSCDVQDWLCTGGGPLTYCGIYDHGYSPIIDGQNLFYFGNAFCNACSQLANDTSCIVNLGCTATGVPAGLPFNTTDYGNTTGVSISQTVSGLTPGGVYVLEFWAGGEPYFQHSGLFGLDIGFGDTLLRNLPTYPTDTGSRFIIQFAATSSSHTIKFTNWGHICNSCTELVVDDVRLYPISQLSSIIPACALNIGQPSSAGKYTVEFEQGLGKLNVITSVAGYSMKIYNATGQIVFAQSYSGNASADLNNITPGIYFYEISDGTESVKNKFTLQ